MRENKNEIFRLTKQFNLNGKVRNGDDIMDLFNEGNKDAIDMVSYYANNKSDLDEKFGSFSRFDGFTRATGGDRFRALNTVGTNLSSAGANKFQELGFKKIVEDLVSKGRVDLQDGISESEKTIMANAYEAFLKGLTGQNELQAEKIEKLIEQMKRLTADLSLEGV